MNTVRCILTNVGTNTKMVLRVLWDANIDVVESHELDSEYILLVVESLPIEVDHRLHNISRTTTMTPHEVTSFLNTVKHGIPAARIFPTHDRGRS